MTATFDDHRSAPTPRPLNLASEILMKLSKSLAEPALPATVLFLSGIARLDFAAAALTLPEILPPSTTMAKTITVIGPLSMSPCPQADTSLSQ